MTSEVYNKWLSLFLIPLFKHLFILTLFVLIRFQNWLRWNGMWRFIKEKKPKYDSVISPQQHITPLHWFSMSNKFYKRIWRIWYFNFFVETLILCVFIRKYCFAMQKNKYVWCIEKNHCTIKTRMHSRRMRTARSSSCLLGGCPGPHSGWGVSRLTPRGVQAHSWGVSASVHAGIHPPGVGLDTPTFLARLPNLPLGLGLDTPPGQTSQPPPWVWT